MTQSKINVVSFKSRIPNFRIEILYVAATLYSLVPLIILQRLNFPVQPSNYFSASICQ